MNLIKEGGNVFKDKLGVPLTKRIQKGDIEDTVKWLESVTGLDLHGPKDPKTGYPSHWLGSTGKKADSGDLDLAIDTGVIDKAQLGAKLQQYVQKSGQDPRDFVKVAGEVHFKTPIRGDAKNGFVQTDFMFFPSVDWGVFYYTAGGNSDYKGMYRNILLSSVAKSIGLKVGSNGIMDRATNKVVSVDPDWLAEKLLGPGHSKEDLITVESIYQALSQDPNREAKLKDFKEFLQKEGMPEPKTSVREDEVSFIARLRDRIVNQGMQPLVEETTVSVLTEAKDPRIPHLEDLVFKSGSRGVKQALDIVKQSAERTSEYVTIKWDGSPAIFFGRKPTGEFVLTDKSGLTAVGYDGQATSPEMMGKIMAMRDQADAAKGKKSQRTQLLTPMYQFIWPYFEAAVPENFRGYVKGDLLYFPQKPYEEVAGNFVFTPNQVEYRIPIDSDLGQQIQGTQIGIAIHSEVESPEAPEKPIDPKTELEPVKGLMMSRPTVKTLQQITPDRALTRQIKGLVNNHGAAIDTLFNPAELRSMEITDLPALMETYINSLVGTDFSGANPNDFLAWLQNNPKVSPRKFNNIYTYIGSPTSNTTGLAAAFVIWKLLYQLKNDVLKQLDLQQPGQEGWVMATPAGRAKAVSRGAGGFASANRQRNQPQSQS